MAVLLLSDGPTSTWAVPYVSHHKTISTGFELTQKKKDALKLRKAVLL